MQQAKIFQQIEHKIKNKSFGIVKKEQASSKVYLKLIADKVDMN